MPIRLDIHDEEPAVDVTPGTNQAQVLGFLYANTGLGFAPKEIADRTAVNHESIYTVLGRLRDRDLVGRTAAGYYHALDDEEAVRVVRSLRSPSDSTRWDADTTGDDTPGQRDSEAGSVAESTLDEPRDEGTDDEASPSTSNAPAGATGGAVLSPDEAFALLGNETRVGILQVLWDAFESGTGENAISFSELFEQVDIRDSGNFSYHLEKLTGPFVRQTADGYELKQTGINVVRAVVAGTVIDDPAFGPTPVDVACPLCDAPVEITYEDEFMNVSCSACEGRSRWNDRSGHLFGALVPPVSVEQRPVEDAFRAAVSYSLHEVAAFHDGIYPDCSSPIETAVDPCPDHDPGEDTRCPACDRFNMADVWMVCATCKRSVPPPVALVVLDNPDVTAFYHEHGIEHRFTSWETVARSYQVREELVSREPLRMRFTVPAGTAELQLTLDGNLNVVDVTP